MAIDPSIALQVRPPQVADPVEAYSRVIGIRGAQQQQQMQALQLQEAQRQMAEEQSLRGLFANGQRPTAEQLIGAAGSRGATVAKSLTELGKEEEARRRQQLEFEQKKLKGFTQSVLAAPPERRQQAYIAGIQNLLRDGVKEAGQLPPQYDDETLANLDAYVTNPSEYLTAQQNKATNERAERDRSDKRQANAVKELFDTADANERQRHNVATEGQQSKEFENTKRHQTVMERIASAQASAARTAANAQVGQRQFAVEDKLRDEFRAESKNFSNVKDSYARISQAIQGKGPMADVSLIFQYMKMLDPGSTVREGEFATVQNSGSIPQRVIAAYNKAMNGDRVHPELRTEIASESEKLFGQAKKDHEVLRKYYGGIAKQYGARPDNILVDYSTTADGPQQPKSPVSGTVKMRAPNGEVSEVPAAMAAHYEQLGAKRL